MFPFGSLGLTAINCALHYIIFVTYLLLTYLIMARETQPTNSVASVPEEMVLCSTDGNS